jgi:hypothetical protein
MFNIISFEKLLQVTADDLAVIKENFGRVYMDDSLSDDTKIVLLAEAFNTIDDWCTYFNRFKEIQDSKLVELNNENIRLKEENSRLNNELDEIVKKFNGQSRRIGELNAKVEYLNELINAKNTTSNMVQVDLVEMIEKLDNVANLINENAKALSLSRKLKNEPRVNMHGAGHPRYVKKFKNEDLINDYESGMILKDLADKYGLSIPGIRNRLIDLGVYKNKYNTNK